MAYQPNTPNTGHHGRYISPLEPGNLNRATQNGLLIDWKTPKSAREVADQLGRYARLTGNSFTQRLLFSKIRKGWDSKDLHLAHAQRKVEQLESQLEAVAPRKKRRVEPDPNNTFVGLREVQRAQNEAGAIEVDREEYPEPDGSSDIVDCIFAAS